jgi:hypothetical protein
MREKFVGRSALPDLGCEEAGEAMLVGDSSEAGLRKRCGVVWEAGGAETGQDAEGEV